MARRVHEIEPVVLEFEGHGRGRDRDAPILFHLHEIRRRAPRIALSADLTGHLDRPAIKEELFRQRRLPRIGVRDDCKGPAAVNLWREIRLVGGTIEHARALAEGAAEGKKRRASIRTEPVQNLYRIRTDTYRNSNWLRKPSWRLLGVQADALDLVDGASVYGYALQRPNFYIDPRGEFGLPAAAVSVGGQLLVNVYLYGDISTALRCIIDITKVVVSAALGALGGNAGAVYGASRTAGNSAGSAAARAGGTALLGSYVKLGLSPITIGDECECAVPEGKGGESLI